VRGVEPFGALAEFVDLVGAHLGGGEREMKCEDIFLYRGVFGDGVGCDAMDGGFD
jgi:hypothetical protein